MDNQEAALPPAFPLDDIIEHYKQDPRMTRAKWVTWACDCAERVLGVFESARPDDMRPRRALGAARTWIADPTEENRKATHAAADAAHAAAYAAHAAAYAAAYAADAAADAAANAAAYAANAAANAAADAAAKDSNAEKTWQAIRLMEIYQWD